MQVAFPQPVLTVKKTPPRSRWSAEPHRAPGFGWTPRKVELLYQLYRFRLVRSDQLIALAQSSDGEGNSYQAVSGDIAKLRHNGYIAVHEESKRRRDGGGSYKNIYTLTRAGARELSERKKIALDRFEWLLKRNLKKGHGTNNLEHTVLTADVVLAIEIACRQSGGAVRFIDKHRLLDLNEHLHEEKAPFQWPVKVAGYERTQTCKPDYIFALHYTDTNKVNLFFLEVDRGMVIDRRDKQQSHVGRHMDKYYAYYRETQGKRTRFGTGNFRVLFALDEQKEMKKRVLNLLARSRKTAGNQGTGIFVFNRKTDIVPHVQRSGRRTAHFLDVETKRVVDCRPFLEAQWMTGRGELTTLLDH